MKRNDAPRRRALPLAAGLALLCCGAPAAQEPPAPQERREVRIERADGGAWIGVLMTEALDGGVRLVAVVPSGPAARAGLRAGDVVLELDGTPVADRRALRDRIAASGERRLDVTFVREGQVRRVELRPESRRPSIWTPAPRPTPSTGLAGLGGVRLVELTPELRVHYGAPEDRGLLVVSVAGSGEAAPSGALAVGDVVVEACGRPLRREAEWFACRATSLADGTITATRVRGGRAESVAFAAGPPAGARLGSILESWVSDEAARERRRAELSREIERLKARLAELEAARDALADEKP